MKQHEINNSINKIITERMLWGMLSIIESVAVFGLAKLIIYSDLKSTDLVYSIGQITIMLLGIILFFFTIYAMAKTLGCKPQ